jgi:hypothetical protein
VQNTGSIQNPISSCSDLGKLKLFSHCGQHLWYPWSTKEKKKTLELAAFSIFTDISKDITAVVVLFFILLSI